MEQNHTNCCLNLLEEFNSKEFSYESEILEFAGIENLDVYNISHPFKIGNKTVIAGRVEKRNEWAKSNVFFFEKTSYSWKVIEDAPVLNLEDAFATSLTDETILGGVEVYTINNKFNSNEIGYRTVFYRGNDLNSLEKFACGPDRMKDIRIVPLSNGKISVCTRPQGGVHGRGQIGSLEIHRVEEINEENILKAKIIDELFAFGQWGGANELHVLKDGKIGVLGHIAYEDENYNKHYYAMTFVYDPITHEASPIKLLATRKNFPKGYAKMPQLEDVVFPGGLVRHKNGYATLYAGLSDAQAGCITLPDPFQEL